MASGQSYKSPGSVFVEGDASSASYFLAAGAITGGPVTVVRGWVGDDDEDGSDIRGFRSSYDDGVMLVVPIYGADWMTRPFFFLSNSCARFPF